MKKAISTFLRYGTLISTYGLIISVLIQIFARFLLPQAPPWTEEASRLFFIYAISFAAGLAFESGDYIHLDWFFEKLPPKLQRYVRLSIALLSLILFALMGFFAIQFMVLGHVEMSSGLKIPMSFLFFSMVVLALSMSYFAWLEFKEVNQKASL